MEQLPKKDIAVQYETLFESEPKLVINFVPEDTSEQRDIFMKDQILNPDHSYPKLASINLEQTIAAIKQTGEQILENPALNSKCRAVYEAFVSGYLKKTRLLRGTDKLPWFKDLAYYNGSVGMWRHLESI